MSSSVVVLPCCRQLPSVVVLPCRRQLPFVVVLPCCRQLPSVVVLPCCRQLLPCRHQLLRSRPSVLSSVLLRRRPSVLSSAPSVVLLRLLLLHAVDAAETAGATAATARVRLSTLRQPLMTPRCCGVVRQSAWSEFWVTGARACRPASCRC